MKNSSITSYFLLFLLVAQTGFPFFVGDTWLLIVFSFTTVIFILKRKSVNSFILKYILGFIFLMVVQVLFTMNFLMGPFFGILLRIIYAYMAIKIIGPNFMKYYINLLYFFTVIGLFLWFSFAYIPGLYTIGSNLYHQFVWPITIFPLEVRQNIIIYTNDYWLLDDYPRNAGPFWEPGGYGVFLVVAILFNTIYEQKLINRKNIVFIIALLTTFSMGVYAGFLIFLYSYLFLIQKIKFSTLFVSILVLIGAYYAFNSFEFLREKFETRYEKSKNLSNDMTYDKLNYQVGRNEQAILDLRSFIKSPIWGEGQFVEYEYGESASGVTDFLRKWGILGFLLVFGSMYKSFKKYSLINQINLNYAWVSVITLLGVALSQSLYGKPLFLGFSFVFMIFNRSDLFQIKILHDDTVKNAT